MLSSTCMKCKGFMFDNKERDHGYCTKCKKTLPRVEHWIAVNKILARISDVKLPRAKDMIKEFYGEGANHKGIKHMNTHELQQRYFLHFGVWATIRASH